MRLKIVDLGKATHDEDRSRLEEDKLEHKEDISRHDEGDRAWCK